jgi:hypothetical protein
MVRQNVRTIDTVSNGTFCHRTWARGIEQRTVRGTILGVLHIGVRVGGVSGFRFLPVNFFAGTLKLNLLRLYNTSLFLGRQDEYIRYIYKFEIFVSSILLLLCTCYSNSPSRAFCYRSKLPVLATKILCPSLCFRIFGFDLPGIRGSVYNLFSTSLTTCLY